MITKLPNNPYNILKTFARGLFLKINELVDAANLDPSNIESQGVILDLSTEVVGATIAIDAGVIPKMGYITAVAASDNKIMYQGNIYFKLNPLAVAPSAAIGWRQRLVAALTYEITTEGSAPITEAAQLEDNLIDAGLCFCITSVTPTEITYDITRNGKTNFLPGDGNALILTF